MDPVSVNLVIAVFTSVLASSGLWTVALKRGENKDKKTKLLLGLAHDRIIYVGKSYIEKGWVSYDEYEDFMTYLYGPYSGFGGNGLAEKIKKEVGNLPMRHARSIELEVEK